MSKFKEPGLTDRQKSANDARKALLERFKAQPGPDDPAVQARAAERREIAERREQTRLERETAKAEQKRLAEAAAAEEAMRVAREKEEEAERAAALEADQKAARDARYAARKQRGKKKR